MRGKAPVSLLHAYRLHRGQCRTVPARTAAHADGELRINPEDLHTLRNSHAGSDYAPVIALFSTGHSNIPVTLQAHETMWVKTGKGARVRRKRSRQEPTQQAGGLEQHTDDADWQALTVTVSHAYVRGMRVSGIIHRAVVRLVRYA